MIERAKGILMERHGIDDKTAFGRLRDHARSGNRRVVEVAQAVVDGHALLPARGHAGLARAPAGNPPGMRADSGSLAAVVRDGRPGPAIEAGDFKRAFARFQKDQVTDHAAALTYYALMSLFPALLFGVALLGFFGQQALVDEAASFLVSVGAPSDTVDAVTKALEGAQESRGTALTALVLALLTSLYGASGAFGAVGRALNTIWRVEEGRGFVKHKAHDVGWTLVVLALVLVTAVLVFLGGALSEFVFEPDRARGHHGGRLALRALARGAAGDGPDLRGRLLRGAQRGDPPLPVDHPGRGVRRAGVAARLGRVLHLRRRTSAPTRRPTARSRPR